MTGGPGLSASREGTVTRGRPALGERGCWAGLGCQVWAERGERTGPAGVREVGEGRTGLVGFLGRVSEGFGLVPFLFLPLFLFLFYF
jgi:hypothetical protein